jgi:hypothetical protein
MIREASRNPKAAGTNELETENTMWLKGEEEP